MMDLYEYLAQVESCPDKKLEGRLGICNNYEIYLKGDFEGIATDIQNLEGFGGVEGPRMSQDGSTPPLFFQSDSSR